MSVPAGHFLRPFYRQTDCVWHISIFFLFLFFFIFFYCCQLACELIVNWLLCGLLTVFTWQAVLPYFSRVLACHLLVNWLVKIFDFLKISLILACQLIVIWVSFGLRPVAVFPLFFKGCGLLSGLRFDQKSTTIFTFTATIIWIHWKINIFRLFYCLSHLFFSPFYVSYYRQWCSRFYPVRPKHSALYLSFATVKILSILRSQTILLWVLHDCLPCTER